MNIKLLIAIALVSANLNSMEQTKPTHAPVKASYNIIANGYLMRMLHEQNYLGLYQEFEVNAPIDQSGKTMVARKTAPAKNIKR